MKNLLKIVIIISLINFKSYNMNYKKTVSKVIGFKELFFIPEYIANIDKDNLENIILYGLDGTGKKTIAKAITREINVDFFSIDLRETNLSLEDLENLISKLKLTDNVFIFIIENIDLASDFLLNLLNKELGNKKIKFIFTTNYIYKVQKNIKSKCERVYISLPCQEKIFNLLKYFSKEFKNNFKDNFFRSLAKKIDRSNCKTIEKLVKKAIFIEPEKGYLDKHDYLVSAGKYCKEIRPSKKVRLALFKYHFKKRDLNVSSQELDLLSNESQGFSNLEIKRAVKFIQYYCLNSKVLNSDILSDMLYASLYYNQKIKSPSKEIRNRIIRYFLNYYNIDLDQEILSDFQKYAEIELMSGRDIEEITYNILKYNYNLKTNFYLSLYKNLKYKAIPAEFIITRHINEENLYFYKSFQDTKYFNCFSINQNNIEEFNFIEYRLIGNYRNFEEYKIESENFYQINRLDFLNSSIPRLKARKVLIKYFLNKQEHKLTKNQIAELIIRTKNISWYSLKKSILTDFRDSKNLDYKSLRENLYINYGIFLKEDPDNLKKSCKLM